MNPGSSFVVVVLLGEKDNLGSFSHGAGYEVMIDLSRSSQDCTYQHEKLLIFRFSFSPFLFFSAFPSFSSFPSTQKN
uniref:Uncharacterized protein n=1 Tax=Nelumbo nucifera TaxID=4432 RepID=A0A822XR18_NELNU|nr:TPA_asm: hypothetical protein HUJ06_021381 [Nelumbo nucifera]